MMYLKIALDNIKKNSRTYLPYIFSNVVTFAMLYIMGSLSGNPMIWALRGGAIIANMMEFGNYIMYFFTTIFMIYTSNFISKQRRKEFGLFSILGMEKRHITKVVLYENFFTAVITIIFGSICGVLFDKLVFLLVLKVLGEGVKLGFYFSKESLIIVSAFTAVVFLIISILSILRVCFSSTLSLMKSSRTGEKEPKARWFIALLAIVCLAAGYCLSIFTKDVRDGIGSFFIAVLLVIAGTYLLFTAGTIAILKLLKKNKNYYYKTTHFVSVSSMMYRMKQNALGLASLCVLSTMVLVMMSTTISLLVGINDSIEVSHPYDINISSDYAETMILAEEFLEQENIEITESIKYEEISFYTKYDGDSAFEEIDWGENTDAKWLIWIIPQNYYNQISHRNISLEKDEALYCDRTGALDLDNFRILGKELKVAEKLKDINAENYINFQRTLIVVVRDDEVINEICQTQIEAYEDYYTVTGKNYFFSLADKSIDCSDLMDGFFAYLSEYEEREDIYIPFRYSVKSEIKHENLESYGSLFFVGVFLGILFLMETILIIYYKQISEGMEDKQRFEIMQKVGMSEQEVKSSIGSQVLTVFFMPLIIAGVHTGFAFPILSRLLELNGLRNIRLFIFSTVCVFLIFSLIYAVIYILTARVYYRIVRK